MQLGRFTNGGYCLHKITGKWKGNASAWFDKDGVILDAEQIPVPFESSRPIKKGGPMWKAIQKIGLRYKNIPSQ